MASVFTTRPLAVSEVSPRTGKVVRTFFMLGAVPPAVAAAAKRGPGWSAADGATLRQFYGPDWRAMFTPQPPMEDASTAASATILAAAKRAPVRIVSETFIPEVRAFGLDPLWHGGGKAADDDDADTDVADVTTGDFGDLSMIFAEPKPKPSAAVEPRAGRRAAPAAELVFSTVGLFPEDTVYDLKRKLSAVSGVDPYRQLLFYYFNDEGPIYPHQVTSEGLVVPVDWRDLLPREGPATTLAGLPVLPQLEQAGYQIAALDTFTRLAPQPGIRMTRAYFVDLEAAVEPLTAAGRRPDGLARVLQDPYQFALFYHGGLVRFWPWLATAAAASVALTAPGQLPEQFPRLAPDAGELEAEAAAQQKAAAAAAKWAARAAARPPPPRSVAVTAASVATTPEASRVRVAVRNAFDAVATGEDLPAAVAVFTMDAALLTEAGVPVDESMHRQSGAVRVRAQKRHRCSYGAAGGELEDFLAAAAAAPPPRADALVCVLKREGSAPGVEAVRPDTYAYFTVRASGVTETRAQWREDDRVGPEAAIREVAGLVGGLVAALNREERVFPLGGGLAAPEPGRAAVGRLTASAYWPHAVTGQGFAQLRRRLREWLEAAGLATVRGLQTAGAFIFAFRKGIVSYGRSEADRIEPVVGRNQYAWLVDDAVNEKWAAVFGGRLVRIHHRATDLRVEVVGADTLQEFEMVRAYVFAFLDAELARGEPWARAAAATGAPASPTPGRPSDSRRLQRLQERDPNLYLLKKYDPAATVYSVLCQSGRQPVSYSEEELAQLPAAKRGQLTRYWNFTTNEPAWYLCPNPQYRHLSFRPGVHPLGWCLPCCKKMPPVPGTRAEATNRHCLENVPSGASAKPSGASAAAEASLADKASIPDAQSRHVLSWGKSVPAGRLSEPPAALASLLMDAAPAPLRLLGVDQARPRVPAAGFAFALATALAQAEGAEGVLRELAATAAGLDHYGLGGGAGAVFETAAALADEIVAAFVTGEGGLSPFGPGGEAESRWPAILADLARIRYGTETIVVEAGGLSTRLRSQAPAATARAVVLVAAPHGTYPLAAVDQSAWLRAEAEHRWTHAQAVFRRSSRVLGVLLEALTGSAAEASAPSPLQLLLDGAAEGRWGCPELLVDMHGRCYGAVVVAGGAPHGAPQGASRDARGWLPIPYERPPMPLPKGTVLRPGAPEGPRAPAQLVDDLNGYAAKNGYPPPIPAELLVTPPWLHGADNELAAAVAAKIRGEDAPPAQHRERQRLASEARALNGLWSSYVAHFAAAIRRERNQEMRARISALIAGTRFSNSRQVQQLKKGLAALGLAAEDQAAIRAAITRAYSQAERSGETVNALAARALAATAFLFDRQTLGALRACPPDEVRPRIAAVMADFKAGAAATGAIGADLLADFCDCLAADVRSGTKQGVIAAALAEGDPLEFTRRPGEHLRVLLHRAPAAPESVAPQ